MYTSPDLPTGTLTFLFTDVENSTRLWDRNPTLMRAAMERHDELIESIVAENQGTVVRPRGEGDSRFAVFRRASNAVNAAAAVQRRFFGETWPVLSPLQVRIGLHTGEADLREGDYYGPAVNRCARIRGLAHGGQTLLSQATFNLVQDFLPEGASLRELGEYQLAGLQRTELIYQLVIPGLRADFPPLQGSAEKYRSNLPAVLTSFIGRASEISELKELILSNRLLTVAGVGGSGKTRLAVQVGTEIQEHFDDGVWLVDLAPITNPQLVTKAVADVLGIREEEEQPLSRTLIEALRSKSSLLILDNCEHLLQEVARLCSTLVVSARRLHILATSREPLNLAGETVWTIPPLSFPKHATEEEVSSLMDYDAVQLFVNRAVAARPTFKLHSKNAAAVLRISQKLEGNPLAIELASARVKVLSVEDIAERLENCFKLLVGNKSTAHPRQQTLEALINWSHDLLSEKEQVLMRRLGVFKGGWVLEAAEEICSGEEINSWEVLDLLTNLIDKSLVVSEMQDDHQRYRFLEMIRQYSVERLKESGEIGQISEKHAVYFLDRAEESFEDLWGPKQGWWLSYLQTEHDNLRASLEWFKEEQSRAERLLRMSVSLWRFWEIHGHISEGRAWLELALERNPSETSTLRANGLRGAGILARQQGDYVLAKALHEQSLALFRQIGDRLGIARELDVLGEILWMEGNPQAAVELSTESLEMHRDIGNMEGIAGALENLGVLARDHGDYQRARELLEESLEKYRELGNILFTASCLNNLGLLSYLRCEYNQANALFDEALSYYRQLNDRWGTSETLVHLGNVAKDQGNFKLAAVLFNESLVLKHELGDKHGIAKATSGLAEVAFYQGDYPTAIQLSEQSYSLFKERGVKRGMVISLMVMAVSLIFQGDIDAAQNLAEEGLVLSSDIDTPRSLAYTKVIFGLGEYNRGNLDAALQYHQDALVIFRKIDDGRSIAQTLVNLARTAYRKGDRESALAYLDESLSLSRKLDTRWSLAFSLEIMGLVTRSGGDLQTALDLFKESLALSQEQANLQGIANGLGAIAGLAALNNQPAQSARLFAAAANLRETMNVKMGADDQAEYEHYITLLRDVLDEEQFTRLMLEGCSINADEAVEQARQLEYLTESGAEEVMG